MNEQPSATMPDISSAISKIMEHPELISMVASVLGEPQRSDAPLEEQIKEEATAKDIPTPPPDVLASVMPMIAKLSSLGGKGGDGVSGQGLGHEQLLCALKPYISHSRAEAIDYIIKFSKMSSLLQGLK